MKLLFFTDIHLSGTPPRHRIDDYPRTLLAKLAEVYEIAEAENCDAVLFGGDMFNSHRTYSFEVIGAALDIFALREVHTYAIVGQHDVHGYNPDSYQSSTLNFVEHLAPLLTVLFEPIDVGCVRLFPSNVWDDMNDSCVAELRKGAVNILLAHHLLTNRRAMFEVVSTADYGPVCPFDLVLSGDLHDGYKTHEVEGTWFCNPGALARRTISEIERWPQVALIDVEPGQTPVIEVRRLKGALPGEQVFTQVVPESTLAGSFDAEDVIKGMEEFEAEAVDIHELIQNVGQESGIPKPVLDYLASKKPSVA